MVGVKKKRVSLLVRLVSLFRKSGPTIGRSFRIGIPFEVEVSWRLTIPPTTIVWPLATRRRAVSCVIVWFGIRCPFGPTDSPRKRDNWNGMIIVMVPSPLILGVARSCVGALNATG